MNYRYVSVDTVSTLFFVQ